MSPENSEQLAAPFPQITASSARTRPVPPDLTPYARLLRTFSTNLRKIAEDRPGLLLTGAFLSGAFFGRKLRP